MVDPEFEELKQLHNSARYLIPNDLETMQVLPRRALIVGSCLAEVLAPLPKCPTDFILTNNSGELGNSLPKPIEDYDLQVVQVATL
jgi:hypothetical protein